MTRAGIVGVTGYTGMELLRILSRHPDVQLTYATSRRLAGSTLGEKFSYLTGDIGSLVISDLNANEAAEKADIVFLCLPHGDAMNTAAELNEKGVKVIDLSADLRIKDPKIFGKWYGPHSQPQLLDIAVAGYPEIYRQMIAKATLVANPGCYPTSIVLAALPLLEGKLIDPNTLISDSKSGVSGAGREPRDDLHFPEVDGNFSAYSIAGSHRHIAEMEQELTCLAGTDVRLTFTPHLIPVSRGIFSTVYAKIKGGIDEDEIISCFDARFEDEPFVKTIGKDMPLPSIKDVRGTNMCHIAPRIDTRTDTLVVISCLDNLVKGAAGQAVQNMNLMSGFNESSGLDILPLLP